MASIQLIVLHETDIKAVCRINRRLNMAGFPFSGFRLIRSFDDASIHIKDDVRFQSSYMGSLYM